MKTILRNYLWRKAEQLSEALTTEELTEFFEVYENHIFQEYKKTKKIRFDELNMQMICQLAISMKELE